MEKYGSGTNKSPDNEEMDKRFNTGGNDSDYDGGQPTDSSSESAGSIKSNSENKSGESEEKEKDKDKDKDKGNSFNRGGNDSDYDGGHPADTQQGSKGRVESNGENPQK